MTEFLQTNKSVQIRRLYLEDLDQLMEIEPKVFGSHHWTRNNFARELDNRVATYVVAERDGKILGYAGSWTVATEMHITTLGVDPECRRQGIAESIIVALIDLAMRSNVEAITLEVRLSNVAAQNLYSKYLFRRAGLRKRYYEDNHEDAVILWTENINTAKFREVFEANAQALQKHS